MSNVPFFKSEQLYPGAWIIRYEFAKDALSHVMAYLVEGRDYALVIDTMNGRGNMRAYCETLTLKLVNTHFHGDHTGGNYDFDACYIHHLDLPYLYGRMPGEGTTAFERGRNAAKHEYADLVDASDFTEPHSIRVYLLYEGDIFDLGDREIEVSTVGGHTPGCICLLDRANRAIFSGDCCNSNTGVRGPVPSVEEYLENLLHLKQFQSEFDIMYGGQQILPPSVIDDGIELVSRVIVGTDDKDERPSPFGNGSVYHAAKTMAEGKRFNMSYNPAIYSAQATSAPENRINFLEKHYKNRRGRIAFNLAILPRLLYFVDRSFNLHVLQQNDQTMSCFYTSLPYHSIEFQRRCNRPFFLGRTDWLFGIFILGEIVVCPLNNTVLSFDLSDIEIADFQSAMLQHIFLDFLIGSFAFRRGQIQLVHVQFNLDMLFGIKFGQKTYSLYMCCLVATTMSHWISCSS